MKLITFNDGNGLRLGAVVDLKVIDLQKAYFLKLLADGIEKPKIIAETTLPHDPSLFLQGGKASLKAAEEAIDFVIFSSDTRAVFQIDDVYIGPPVIKPNKIICVGHNYREHILEMKREIPEYPVLFAKFNNTVIGPQDDIPYFSITEKLDYEAEFGVVIGRRAKSVTRENALDYVAGYTIVNDVTSRDLQRRTIQWFQGKSVDGSAPIGPWLVTSDEIQDPSGLEMVLTVNGEERQRTNTKNLVFDVPFLVEYLSNIMTLEPGDVICTGTPGGVGFAMEPQQFLQDGDIVRIEIDKIGVLENKVRKVNQVLVKEYISKVQSKIGEFVKVVNDSPAEIINWKPTKEKWSILEIVSHVEEANRFWIQELLKTIDNPTVLYGRGLNHQGRIKAVELSETQSLHSLLEKINEFKLVIHEKLLSIYDEDLKINATHKNPKFGSNSLTFLLDHFLIEHIEKHIVQVKRNVSQYYEKQ